jgi:transcriptional regulator with XRE-family HTH domain
MPRIKISNGHTKQPNVRSATPVDVLIGQRLRTRRMEQGISQSDLAAPLGVTFQQVQKYEKGVNRIGASRLQAIANILETDMEYFLGKSNAKPAAPSKLSAFMSTKDGVAIVSAMMRLDEPHRRGVILLARTLAGAYGEEAEG